MKKTSLTIIIVLTAAVFSSTLFAGVSTGTTLSSFNFSSNGNSESASVSYSNSSITGLSGTENSESASYKNFAGFLAANVNAIDVAVTFVDESPTASEWQNTNNVTCKITVETTDGNPISSVRYRISNAGADEDSFMAWRTDASVDTAISASKVRYAISIPNAAGQSFTDTEDNYIQWRARNSGGLETFSGKYRVRVSSNDAPTIVILQPDEKGGIASERPLIEATITDTKWGVNASSVTIKIDRADGTSVMQLTSGDRPAIFTAADNKLSYKYDQAPLTADGVYTLTVSAADNDNKIGSKSVTFTVKGGAIADLVPYPSPFDPKVQPVTIRYVLNKNATVSVNIYDMSGRLARTVVDNQSKNAGINEDTWTGVNYAGEGLANGVYYCEIAAKDEDGEHRSYTALAIFGK